MTDKTDKITFEDGLTRLPDQYLNCRDMRHHWYNQGYVPLVGETAVVVRIKRTATCSHCGAEREDIIDAKTFDRIRSQYRYPKGYVISGVERSHTPANDVRREAYLRSIARKR